MKLPGINYRTQTQSLGRQDIGAPLRTAGAKSSIISTVSGTAIRILEAKEAEEQRLQANALKVINANEVAIEASRFQANMAELNASIKSRKSYTVEELDFLGVNYDRKYGHDKITEVPAYLVSKKVYQSLSSKTYKMSLGSTSIEGRSVISKMYGKMYKEGIGPVIENSIKEAYRARATENELAFEDVVSAGNAEAAMIIAETALNTGVWGHDKYLSKVRGVNDRISKSRYMNALNTSDDTVALETQLDAALNDPNLTTESQSALFTKYDAKIAKLTKAKNLELKIEGDERSYKIYVDAATLILQSGETLDWRHVNLLASAMRPVDGKALITMNKMTKVKGIVTDPKVLTALTVQVKSLSIPREGTTMAERRGSMVDALNEAVGYDPVTGNKVGSAKISSKEFASLFDQINKAQAFAYNSPDVKRKADFIWQTLTGGSKDMMTSVFGAGPDTLNATEAEFAMLEASVAEGPRFDPDLWWKANGAKYLTKAIEENEKSLKVNRMDKFIVKGLNFPGGIDMPATVKGLAIRVKRGEMTQTEADSTSKKIYEHMKARVDRLELMKGATE